MVMILLSFFFAVAVTDIAGREIPSWWDMSDSTSYHLFSVRQDRTLKIGDIDILKVSPGSLRRHKIIGGGGVDGRRGEGRKESGKKRTLLKLFKPIAICLWFTSKWRKFNSFSGLRSSSTISNQKQLVIYVKVFYRCLQDMWLRVATKDRDICVQFMVPIFRSIFLRDEVTKK